MCIHIMPIGSGPNCPLKKYIPAKYAQHTNWVLQKLASAISKITKNYGFP